MTIEHELLDQIASCPKMEGESYEAVKEKLRGIDNTYKTWLAAKLEPSFVAQARSMPMQTHEEKTALAKWINRELRHFGLAARCPKTGQPSLITSAFLERNRNNQSQFRYATVDETTHHRTCRAFENNLDRLAIVPDSLERLFFAEHGGIRTGGNDGKRSR